VINDVCTSQKHDRYAGKWQAPLSIDSSSSAERPPNTLEISTLVRTKVNK